MRKTAGPLVATLLAVAACGHSTVEEACDAVSSCEDLVTNCVEEGKALEAESAEKGCESEFADYLDCVAASGCEFVADCLDEAAEVEGCGVDLTVDQ